MSMYRLSLLSFVLVTTFLTGLSAHSAANSDASASLSSGTKSSLLSAPTVSSSAAKSNDSSAESSVATTSSSVGSADSSSSCVDLTPAQEAQVCIQLTQLEKRLFFEVHTTDTVDQRLGRLEKFVFGGVRKGSITTRLNRLTMDIPPMTPSSSATASTASASSAGASAAPTSTASSVSSSGGAGGASSAGSSDSDGPSGEDYPTIDALEKAILGHTNQNLSLNKRLDNLEVKAFGKASAPNADFALRVDRLKAYERSKSGGNDDYLAQGTPTFVSGQPAQTLPLTSQLDLLEKVVFAKTYSKDGVVSRLDRLEKTVYPNKPLDSFSSVPTRVARLEHDLQINNAGDTDRIASSYGGDYAGGGSYVPAFQDPRQQQKSAHHSFLHKLGSVLGTIGEAAAMSIGSSMMYGGYGYPGYGYGYGGYPGGMYGGGMGPGFYF